MAVARAGWWNGVNILVHDPLHALERILPPTQRERDLYHNDRIVHSSNIAQSVPRAIRVAQLLDQKRWLRWLRESKWLYDEMSETRQHRSALFTETNTYSAGLPASRFAALAAASQPAH